jgi:hypothetical protein
MAVYGEKPYDVWTNARVWVEVQNGYTLPRPPHCNESFYVVMRSCWAKVGLSVRARRGVLWHGDQ